MLAKGLVTSGLIASVLKAELVGPPDLVITGFDAIDTGGPGVLTFIRDHTYTAAWAKSRCSAAIVARGLKIDGHDPSKRALLIVPDAEMAVVQLLKLITPVEAVSPGRHPTAIIDPSAHIDPGASIAAGVVIGPGCRVSAGVSIGVHCVLGRDVTIGPGSRLGPRVHLGDRTVVGTNVILHTGVVLGCDGFAYRPNPDGSGYVKLPHVGNVVVEDNVEIGANSCIDRGRFGPTRIGMGTKIDNLVQIAHNCQIGKHVIICGCTGIAGSVRIGDHAVVGGHVGIADNLTIGRNAKVGAKSAVMHSVPDNGYIAGVPALLGREAFKLVAYVRRMLADRGKGPG
jgi:UDP-3-O-[3-hydroxymyristoyl] glucosamine N-acyltransferase